MMGPAVFVVCVSSRSGSLMQYVVSFLEFAPRLARIHQGPSDLPSPFVGKKGESVHDVRQSDCCDFFKQTPLLSTFTPFVQPFGVSPTPKTD